MDLFISNAYAASSGQQDGGMGTLLMIAVVGIMMYLMIYRPQSKRVKEHKALISAMAKGDEVLTQGGIVGKVVKVSEEKDFVRVSISETVEIAVQKASITAVLPKGTMKSL